MRFAVAIFTLFLAFGYAQDAKEGSAGDAQKVVTIRKIVVEGTRIPTLSVIRLAQIKAFDQVDFSKLQKAIGGITASGVISKVDFEYESLPGEESNVILHLKCTDAMPLAKARIELSGVNEEDVWSWLAKVDPLFTRELPPNDAAIRLYESWIAKYVESHGDPSFHENFAVVDEGTNSTGGKVPDHLVFRAAKRRGVKGK